MNENKRIRQIGENSFLFFINDNKVFYFLSFENIKILDIKIILIKIMLKETYVYETIIPFNKLGSDEPTPLDTIKNIKSIIYNNDFIMKEELNKIILSLTTKSEGKIVIELNLYDKNKESENNLSNKNHINNMKKFINDLLNTVSLQDKKINELQQKENEHKKLINKIEEITNNISKQLANNNNNNNNNNQYNNNQYNNNNNNNNPYANNQNPYDINNNMGHLRMKTMQNFNNNNRFDNNINNNPTIKTNVNVVYNPFLPENSNINNLLTRPQGGPPPQMPKVEKQKTINLDNIGNYYH